MDNADSDSSSGKMKIQVIEYLTNSGSKFYCIRQLDDEGFPSGKENWIRESNEDNKFKNIVSGSRSYGFCLDKGNLKGHKSGKEGISDAEKYVEMAKEIGYSGEKGRILFAFRKDDGKIRLSYSSTVKNEKQVIGKELERILEMYSENLEDTQITDSPEEVSDFKLKSDFSDIQVVEDENLLEIEGEDSDKKT